jgi:hypothetical protein
MQRGETEVPEVRTSHVRNTNQEELSAISDRPSAKLASEPS